jgi:UDP-glucose 4-epimerase
MKHILITGVAGMIGSHFLDRIIDEDYFITGIDNLSTGNLDNIKHNLERENFIFKKGDLLEFDFLSENVNRVDCILHLAATKKISEKGNAAETLYVNTACTENCLKLAKDKGAKLVFASTSDVYGMSKVVPITEDSDIVLGPPHAKRWSYAVSKLYCEQLCYAYYKESAVPVVILRYFGSFSSRSSFSWRGGHLPIFIDQILKNKPVTIHGDGSQTRSMAAIDDVVNGTLLSILEERATGEIINIGNNEEMGILESAKLIHRLADTGNELKVKFIPMKEIFGSYQEISRRVPDLTKAKKLLGYQPKVKFESYLSDTISEYRKQLGL